MTLHELGITLFPEYIQSEGVSSVLETLVDRVGATSVTTSPYVAARAAAGEGHREPPIDGGDGKARLLDRPLWGEREVWLHAASSFRPTAARYRSLDYRPPEADALTDSEGPVIGRFLDAAKSRGLDTWMQVQAAIPPGHRVQFGGPVDGDHCLLPDGSAVTGRVDNNVSLASEALRHYMRAFVADLCEAYPQVDGFKFDWPEYPVYRFESLFFDFNPAAARFATPLGLDLELLRQGCLAFLADLSSGAVRRRRIALDDIESFRDSLLSAYPILHDLLAFRRAIVADYAQFLHDTLAHASGGRCQLFLQCFPPPLNIATGFDLPTIAARCDVIGVKMYTMHWPMIERNYLRWLTTHTDIAPLRIADALSRLLCLSPREARDVDAIRYPGPDQPHPAASDDIVAKLENARSEIPASTRMVGITHGYGPTDDFLRRLQATADGAGGAVHVNRYCYLSDDKLDALAGYRRNSPMIC